METYTTYKLGNVNYQLEMTEPVQVPNTLWVMGVNVVKSVATDEVLYEVPVVKGYVAGDDISSEPQFIQDIFNIVFR